MYFQPFFLFARSLFTKFGTNSIMDLSLLHSRPGTQITLPGETRKIRGRFFTPLSTFCLKLYLSVSNNALLQSSDRMVKVKWFKDTVVLRGENIGVCCLLSFWSKQWSVYNKKLSKLLHTFPPISSLASTPTSYTNYHWINKLRYKLYVLVIIFN